MHRPFHKTLPKSSSFINRILVRFYETDYGVRIYTLNWIFYWNYVKHNETFFFMIHIALSNSTGI